MDKKEGGKGVGIKFGTDQNIERQELMERLRQRFETRMWENVTPGEATGGLELGTPSLEQVKKCQQRFIKKGRGGQAKCSESIAIHSVWNAARLHPYPSLQICSRCGKK